MTQQHGVKAEKPADFLHREITADFKVLTKALVEGAVDALKADWYGAAKTWGKGFLDGLGLKPDSPEELAWRVVYTTLRQAALSLVEDNLEFLTRTPEDPDHLPDELEFALTEIEIHIGPELLSHAWRLPLLLDLQRPFTRWLLAFGVDKQRAAHIAAQLPQRFGYCLWDEWACHRDTYEPLEQALMVPVQRPQDLYELRRAYLTYLEDSYRSLSLKGLPGVVESVEKGSGLALSNIYVSIHGRSERPEGETWLRTASDPEEVLEEAPPETLREPRPGSSATTPLEPLLAEMPALVILGDPGAGKSTLLKHHALDLANDPLAPLPILIPLNQYAQALEREPQPLRRFLPAYFASRRQNLEELAPLFDHAIGNGRAVILLDGLDEVQAQRGDLVRRVEDFVRELVPAPDADPRRTPLVPGNRVVVTSRFVGYRDSPLAGPRWRTYSVVDWDRDGIERFVDRWSLAVELAMVGGRDSPEVSTRAAAEKRDLLATVFSNAYIERLAGNPLLLTILALIKRQGVTLPHRRVELYELYLETLVASWRKARNLDETPVGPEIDYHSAWHVLAALGLWIRETSPQRDLVGKRPMRDFLDRYYREQEGYAPGEAKAEARAFLDSVHSYSSLLVERGPSQYGFLHQTFGEYLAGCGLTEDPEAVAKLIEHLYDPGWHEAILLGIGALGIVRKDRRKAGALLQDVLDDTPPKDHAAENVLLAGEALRDLGTTGIYKPVADRITKALVETMQGAAVEPAKRRASGLLLGETGWRPDDLDLFVEVPPGKFQYGDDKEEKEISYRYWIARYPVTNAQYAGFIEDDGYRRKELWSGDGWDWIQNETLETPRFWNDPRYNNPIFPVVGVSSHEVAAYANWLLARLEREGLQVPQGRTDLPEGYRVCLPNDREWERAARGTDGREYPWEGGFDFARANVTKSFGMGIGTTAVCSYPLGESPAGAWDLTGNVMEWIRSDFGAARRVLRGGSFLSIPWYARSSFRSGGDPGRRNNLGFRVVVSPFL